MPTYQFGMDLGDPAGDQTVVYTHDPDADWKRQPLNALIGPAGCGKTFFTKAWAAEEKRGALVLAATTGIAAINLGEGTTINSLLGFFDTNSLRESYVAGFLERRLAKLHKAGLRRICLDEVSMLDADQLTYLVRALDDLAGEGYSMQGIEIDGDWNADEVPEPQAPSERPIALTVIGDFCQLPPVKAEFAFTSPEWPRIAAHTKVLTEIRRQADKEYIEALLAVRRGDVDQAVAYFGPRMEPRTVEDFDGPSIFARNEMVGKFNQLRMDKLHTPVVSFKAERWGDQSGDWKQVPELLTLKEGALVMILANCKDALSGDPNRFLYVNGDLGELQHAEGNTAYVKLQRTGEEQAVHMVTREKKVPLEVGRAKQLKAEGHADRIDGKWEIKGAVTYMPLRLAYATTVHKSQGLSLDKVQVNIADHFFATPGMLYVALSRARTAEGLRVVGRPETFRARCTVDARLREWL